MHPGDYAGKIASSADTAFARPITAPHFLKIVELPYFRAEDMDDDIARVDQDPVAMRHSLYPWCGDADLFQGSDHTLGDRSHMRVGAARGDDHHVGDRGFAVQVDGNNVFGL
jgi:hypothetical protein